jgi:hypothetical protein
MSIEFMVMWGGFILASYAVVGNDAIQTLGTFISSNEKRPWYLLWLFASVVLTFTLVYGWYTSFSGDGVGGDVSYQRLERYPLPDPMAWYYLIPPLVLLTITRFGIPVSTSFMVLTFFNPENLGSMMFKSVSGYFVAFIAAIVVYLLVTNLLERKFMERPLHGTNKTMWSIFQLCSTGFLWSMWLIQDFANIFVYLPRDLSFNELIASLVIILSMLAFIFSARGGKIQEIVKVKTNTTDIRSATIIDLTYGIILFYFKELNNIPMSTTWVFLGLLAGRELAVRWRLGKLNSSAWKNVFLDLGKVTLGLFISIALVYIIRGFSDL